MQAQMLKANEEPLSNGHPKVKNICVYCNIQMFITVLLFITLIDRYIAIYLKKHLKSLEVMCKILFDHLLSSITMS